MPEMRLLVIAIACAVLLVACDDGDDTPEPSPAPTETPAASPDDGGGQTSTPTPTPTATATPTPTETPDDEPTSPEQDSLVRCDHEEGFTLSVPGSWHTLGTDGSEGCSQLNPEPFEVPGATDERVAAITAYVDPVPFHEVMASESRQDVDRATTTIDGLQAVRLEYEVGDDHLYPAGTAVTMYAVDLSPGVDEGPGTLFLDTVDLEAFDYARNRTMLDRVARSVEITREDVDAAPEIVARYEGGGGGFSVEGSVTGQEACLRIPPDGEQECVEAPGAADARTVPLVDLEPVLAGVAGEEVFRITVERDDGSTSAFLPAPVDDTGVRGFAFTFSPDEVVDLVAHDVDGEELMRVAGEELPGAGD